MVHCSTDYIDNDLPGPFSPTMPDSYEGCLADCAKTTNCKAVSYIISGPCYLKSGTGSGKVTASNIIAGKLVKVLPTSAGSGPTVTVTTTISNTQYQCACTPTAFPTATPVTCPADNGNVVTTTCGAKYVVECASDRYGNDCE